MEAWSYPQRYGTPHIPVVAGRVVPLVAWRGYGDRGSWHGCNPLDQDLWLCYHEAQSWPEIWLHGRRAGAGGWAQYGGRANRRAVMQVQQAHWERTVAS